MALAVEHFELVPVAGDLAILRLLARLDGPSALPADACLNIVAGDRVRPAVFPAQACRLERRVQSGRSDRGAGQLLWRAAFGLPLRLADDADARFTLTGAGLELTLPSPRRRGARPGVPSLGISAARPGATALSLSARQRVAALATAMIVTATSSPVAALADGAVGTTSPAGAGSGTAAPAPAVAPSAATPASDPSASAAAPAPAPAPATTAPAGTPTATTAPAADATATTSTPTSPAQAQDSSPAPEATSATTAPSATSTTGGQTPGGPAATTSSAAPAAAAPSSAAPAGGRHTGTRRAPVAGEQTGRVIADAPVPSHRAALGYRHRVTRLFASRPPRSQRPAHHDARGGNCSTTTSPATVTDVAAVAALTGARLTLGTRCATSSRPVRATRPSAPSHDVTPGAVLEILPDQPAPHGAGRPARPAHGAAGHAGVHRRIPVARRHPAPPATPGSLRPIVSDPATPAPGASSSGASVSALSSAPAGFLVPRAWTGSVTPDPSLSGAVTDLSGLLADGDRPPSFLVPIFMQAGRRYGIPWPVLAAINAIETDYGRNLNTSSAGAIGWMQFEPSTWKRYGLAVDGHSVPNPYDPRDAIFSAARYLAAAGAAHDLAGAIYAYNHAGWYVQDVLQRATAIAHHVQFKRATIRRGTFSVDFATGRRHHPTVTYRGGVLSHFDRLIAAANMVSAAQFPYLWGGGHEQPANFGPFDCSGSVSYVLQQAGYKVPTSVSGDVGQWKFPTGPGRVTIFFNPTHTFMRIGSRFFGTSLSRPGGGAGWIDVNRLPADYLANFAEVHVPRLGVDSFAPHRHRHRAG